MEIEKGNGDVRDYKICTAAAVVLYDTSTRCTYSSLEPLVPGAAYLVPGTVPGAAYLVRTRYGTCKHPTDYTNQRYGGLSRA